MPFNEVMRKYKDNELHSGSSKGPKVNNKKQALAIMLSEKKKAMGGDTEYEADDNSGMKMNKKKKKGINIGPSKKFMLNKKLMSPSMNQ